MKGILFVVTAPSGTGKTTICDAVMKEVPSLKYSVSATTRPPRPGEIEGKDYFFLIPRDFEEKRRNNEFLEYAQVYDYYYSTPRNYIESELNMGYDIILDIDVQGALSIKAQNYPAVYIYILPPSLPELKVRLKGRKTDSAKVIEKRFAQAREEMKNIDEYDYCIINDDLKTAINDLQAILKAERCRVWRQSKLVKKIIGPETKGVKQDERTIL